MRKAARLFHKKNPPLTVPTEVLVQISKVYLRLPFVLVKLPHLIQKYYLRFNSRVRRRSGI